jgi:FKBP-type peptidyl-prolyl cis-trans isomerase
MRKTLILAAALGFGFSALALADEATATATTPTAVVIAAAPSPVATPGKPKKKRKKAAAPAAVTATAEAVSTPEAPARPDGLKITDQAVGSGAEAVAGKQVSVNYTGRLLTGKTFDTSIGRGPFNFKLGAGQVIKGWDLGVAGMRVGGKRQLVIPAELGYGAAGAGDVIPPNATLVFDVELLGVE